MHDQYNINCKAYKTKDGWRVAKYNIDSNKNIESFKWLDEIRTSFFKKINTEKNDSEINSYIALIKHKSNSEKVSTINGLDSKWILETVKIMTGRQLNMNNDNNYLTLTVSKNGAMKQIIKMGGAFECTIPLIKRQAEELISKPVTWHTWNAPSKPNQWLSNEWFYLLEAN